MNFLDAKKILAELKEGVSFRFLLASSGASDHLELYLRAYAARAGIKAIVESLPFGTLGQHLHASAAQSLDEVYLLLPWDLAPECDWRSGMMTELTDVNEILVRARQVMALLKKRPQARIAYLPAPIPPICSSEADNRLLSYELLSIAARLGARILSRKNFSMPSYLASGCAVDGASLTTVAKELIGLLIDPPPEMFKVLMTDADNTLWAGIVGEDGVDGVFAEPQGLGYRHFIYQSFLRRLKDAGILLAVISRNDEDMVRAPFASGRMPLKIDDFVDIRAGYGAKSDHLLSLSKSLNLGLDSMIFVDDNPIEIAEVTAKFPQVKCFEFPSNDDLLPIFLNKLASVFDRPKLTAEDASRTEMYQRRLASSLPVESAGLQDFLLGLNMVLVIKEWHGGDWTRAFQLINKTNQFNLNGGRFSEAEFSVLLASGARLFTARLDDRTGSHGEILACLVDASGRILAFVLSCRVFQRRVEYAFMIWLLGVLKVAELNFVFIKTERNEPISNFLADKAFRQESDLYILQCAQFIEAHDDLSLFDIRQEDQ